jgi:hypothetical protein
MMRFIRIFRITIKLTVLILFTGINTFSLTSYGYGEQISDQAKAVTSTDRTQVQAPDIRNSAGNAANQQKGGADSNAAMSQGLNMGGTMLIMGGIPMVSSVPPNPAGYAMIAGGVVLMGLGMLAGQQSKEDDQTAGLSGDAMNGFNSANGLGTKGTNAATGNNVIGGGSGTTANDPNASAQFKANQAKLAQLGFKVDPKKMTITTPEGKVINAKDLKTKEGAMAATGISSEGYKDTLAKANDIMAKALSDLKNEKPGGGGGSGDLYGDGGSGGGGGGSRTVIVDEDAGTNGHGAGAGDGTGGKGNSDRGPAEVSGLTKNFHGELIGVSADSIFAMMTRRYVLKDKQNFFLSDAEVKKTTGR